MKKLLAIAIAAGMTAPAIADTTLYGQLHASVDALDADGKSSNTTVASNSSRIGIKGSADLNDGLKLVYKAEFGIDTGGANSSPSKTNTFSERNQYVGVKGGFGTILIGRHDTPMKIIGRKADLFWSTQLGQNRSLTNNKADGNLGLDFRSNNMVAYNSPKIGGFQMLAAYVTNTNELFSVNGLYNAGPLTLGAAYEKREAAVNENDAFRLMGAYKFGAAKVVAFYQNQDVETVATGAAVADEDVYGIGASYKVSPKGTIKGQYYKLDDDIKTNEADLVAVGYDHALGKKTHVYAQYATLSNETGSTLGLGGSGHGEKITPTAGGDADGFSVGIRHKF